MLKRLDNKVFGFVAPFLISPKHPNYQVENEFNAVNVNAKWSHEQLFLGKGAGSEPTASAVLSDVTALNEGYKYAYAQSNSETSNVFTNDFYLKIYLASQNRKHLEDIAFEITDKVYQSDDYYYKTGWVNFQNLKTIDFNKTPDLFFAVLPEEPKLSLKNVDEAFKRRNMNYQQNSF